MSRPEKTEISNDGLRYKSKKGGSPFEGLGRTGEFLLGCRGMAGSGLGQHGGAECKGGEEGQEGFHMRL